MKAILKRSNYTEKQITGILEIYDNGKFKYKCNTLELAWKNNEKNISCIPPGIYVTDKIKSGKRKGDFRVLNVKNRSGILIHSGNYHTHSKGCILVGKSLIDINKDGYKDVTNSNNTMIELNDILPDEFILTIKS